MVIKLDKFKNNISVNNIELFYNYLLKKIPELKELNDTGKINIEKSDRTIYLDLEQITWVDSSFVQIILFLDSILKKYNINIKLLNVNEIIKSEFENSFINLENYMG